jgi:hypothetical protein
VAEAWEHGLEQAALVVVGKPRHLASGYRVALRILIYALMPRWLFVREHARCGGDVPALCEAFGTSRAATERRVQALFGEPV